MGSRCGRSEGSGRAQPANGAHHSHKIRKIRGCAYIDHYDWLRDSGDPRVTAYLDAENAYAKAQLEPIKPLLDEIAVELQSARNARG
jgi:protease II